MTRARNIALIAFAPEDLVLADCHPNPTRPIPSRRDLIVGASAALLMGQTSPPPTPSPPPKSVGPGPGTLLIMGGGGVGPHVADLAWSLTGPAARWVYIPTALMEAQIAGARPPAFVAGARARAQTLHTRDRAVADSESFVAPLREATAVYIDGGRQWRLADAYLDTKVEAELHALLARGGVIAGASAGAAIMSSFLMRGSPMGNGFVVSAGHERGFGFITHSAIDEHVLRRRRQDDLGPVIAAHPDLIGIGLDEGAAALVRGETLTAANDRAVLITDGADHRGRPFYRLPPKARFDLASWRIV